MRPQCRYRFPWRTGYPDNRCPRRTILGVCVEHRLQRFRWERVTPHWLVALDLTMLNRPRLSVDPDRPRRWLSLSWSNGNSDPVWMIEVRR